MNIYRQSCKGPSDQQIQPQELVCDLNISVRFFTSLREITGKREELLQLPDEDIVTIERVLKVLSQKHGTQFVEYVFSKETGEVRGFLQFLVNGKNLEQKSLQTVLKNDDVLAILPPVGGG